jgi:hypothetical protein
MKSKKDKTVNPFQFGVVIDDSAFCNRKSEIDFYTNCPLVHH